MIASNLHIWPLICIIMNMHTIFFLQNVFILFIGLCLENKTCQLVSLPAWLQILKRKLLSSGAKVTIWWPFCLCKLGGQDLTILLGNRVFRIQHTLIRLKSPVPNFYSKMPLKVYRALFFRNSTSLCSVIGNILNLSSVYLVHFNIVDLTVTTFKFKELYTWCLKETITYFGFKWMPAYRIVLYNVHATKLRYRTLHICYSLVMLRRKIDLLIFDLIKERSIES